MTSTRTRKQLTITFALAFVLCLPAPARADYSWTIPGTNVQCLGGDVSAPTIGSWFLSNYPVAYAQLTPNQQTVVNNVYDGTTCSLIKVGVAPLETSFFLTDLLPAGGGGQVSGGWSSDPFGYCEPPWDEGTPTHPGCITGYTTLDVTYHPGWWDTHFNDVLEADIYLANDTVTWVAIKGSHHDNYGHTWGVSRSQYTFNYGDHIGYGSRLEGNGTFVWADPNPFVMAAKYGGHITHVGYKATATQHWNGQNVSQNACLFTDFRTWNASVIGAGACIDA